MSLDKPRLIFKGDVDRSRYRRRFVLALLGVLGAFGAWVALDLASAEVSIDPLVLNVGLLLAALVGTLMALRAVVALVRWLFTRSEKVRVYDQGFTWERRGKTKKYSWGQVKTFRAGGRTRRLFGRTVLQTGAHVLTTRDGTVYRLTPRHGDLGRFLTVAQPYIADATGTLMGRSLRQKKGFQLHPQLKVRPAGVEAGPHKVPWSRLDVRVTNGRLQIMQMNGDGRFKTVKQYKVGQVNNVAAFLDVADSTIRNHQPQRFNIKTQGMQYG